MIIKKVRFGVFETNSSSDHSLCFGTDAEEFLKDYIPLDDNGNVVLEGGEFGRGMRKFNDALTKANYVAVSCEMRDLEIDGVDTDYGTLKKLLIEIIKEQTKCNDVIFDINTDVPYEDYEKGVQESGIDHESTSLIMDKIGLDKEKLYNFIFNKNSYLYVTGDEYDRPYNFYDKDSELDYFGFEVVITLPKEVEETYEDENEHFHMKKRYIKDFQYRKKLKFYPTHQDILDMLDCKSTNERSNYSSEGEFESLSFIKRKPELHISFKRSFMWNLENLKDFVLSHFNKHKNVFLLHSRPYSNELRKSKVYWYINKKNTVDFEKQLIYLYTGSEWWESKRIKEKRLSFGIPYEIVRLNPETDEVE